MPLPLRGRGVVKRSDLAQGIINPMNKRRSGFKGKGAAIQAGRTALAPPNTPKKKKEKNIERPAGAVVYYSMNNLRGRLGSTRQARRGLGCDTDSSTNSEGIIEGTTNRTVLSPLREHGCVSDLSPFPLSKRFDARLHGAGINDEENAGRYSIRMSATLGDRGSALVCERWVPHRGREIVWLMAVSALSNTAPHCYRNHGNPYIEKGMHTRSQQIFLAGAGWVAEADAHARGVAVAQRLHSESFGGGETRESETSLTFGEISEVWHPASFSL
jgi:hypothetical protein